MIGERGRRLSGGPAPAPGDRPRAPARRAGARARRADDRPRRPRPGAGPGAAAAPDARAHDDLISPHAERRARGRRRRRARRRRGDRARRARRAARSRRCLRRAVGDPGRERTHGAPGGRPCLTRGPCAAAAASRRATRSSSIWPGARRSTSTTPGTRAATAAWRSRRCGPTGRVSRGVAKRLRREGRLLRAPGPPAPRARLRDRRRAAADGRARAAARRAARRRARRRSRDRCPPGRSRCSAPSSARPCATCTRTASSTSTSSPAT